MIGTSLAGGGRGGVLRYYEMRKEEEEWKEEGEESQIISLRFRYCRDPMFVCGEYENKPCPG